VLWMYYLDVSDVNTKATTEAVLTMDKSDVSDVYTKATTEVVMPMNKPSCGSQLTIVLRLPISVMEKVIAVRKLAVVGIDISGIVPVVKPLEMSFPLSLTLDDVEVEAAFRQCEVCDIAIGEESAITNLANRQLFSKEAAIRLRRLIPDVDHEQTDFTGSDPPIVKALFSAGVPGFYTYSILNSMVILWSLLEDFTSVHSYMVQRKCRLG
jgi:hypothetical protein